MNGIEFYEFMSESELKYFYKEIKTNKTLHPDNEQTRYELGLIETVAKNRGIELD